MRLKITIVCLILSLYSFGQNVDIKGHVIYVQDSTDFVGVNIYLMKNGIVVYGGVTDGKGNYEIKNVQVGIYDIKLSFIGFKYKLIPNYEIKSGLQNIDFIYPNSCTKKDKICPYGHKNKIIPIIYGLPGTRLMKKAEKGKIKLGGCIVSDCDPKWHCKIHNIDF